MPTHLQYFNDITVMDGWEGGVMGRKLWVLDFFNLGEN